MSEVLSSDIDRINGERIKSDAALLAGGAVFSSGQLIITDEQWFEIYTEHDYSPIDTDNSALQVQNPSELVSPEANNALITSTTKTLTLKPTHEPKIEDITEVAIEKIDRIEQFRDEIRGVVFPYTKLFDELKPARKTAQKGFWRKRLYEYQPNFKRDWDFKLVDDIDDDITSTKEHRVSLNVNYNADVDNVPSVNMVAVRSEYGFYTYLKYTDGKIDFVTFEAPLYNLSLIRKGANVKEKDDDRAVLKDVGTNRSGVDYGIYDFASNWDHNTEHYRGFKITVGINDKAPTITIDDAYNAETHYYVDQSKTYMYDPESDTLLLTKGSKGPKQITKEQYVNILTDILSTIPAQAE